VSSFKAISTDNLISSHQILVLTNNPTFLLFLRIQKSIFLKVAFFQSSWLPPQNNSVLHLMVLVLFTLQRPNGRHIDDANDKFKILNVKMSVSPVGWYL
jgi:hypothetical protein